LSNQQKLLEGQKTDMQNKFNSQINTLDLQLAQAQQKIDSLKNGLKSKFFDGTAGVVGAMFEKEINSILANSGVGTISVDNSSNTPNQDRRFKQN